MAPRSRRRLRRRPEAQGDVSAARPHLEAGPEPGLQRKGMRGGQPTLLAGMRAGADAGGPMRSGYVTALWPPRPHGGPRGGGASAVAPTPVLRRRPACPWVESGTFSFSGPTFRARRTTSAVSAGRGSLRRAAGRAVGELCTCVGSAPWRERRPGARLFRLGS